MLLTFGDLVSFIYTVHIVTKVHGSEFFNKLAVIKDTNETVNKL